MSIEVNWGELGVKFINLTPHPVNLIQEGKPEIIIPPSGKVCRLIEDTHTLNPLNGYPVRTVVYGRNPVNLPDPETGVVYLVSTMVLPHCTHRKDVVAPHDFVRDEAGKTIGCRGFQTAAIPLKLKLKLIWRSWISKFVTE